MTKLKFIVNILLLIFVMALKAQVASSWGNFPKTIIGTPSPLNNVDPFTSMTNIGQGVWSYSNYFSVGASLSVKFGVQTNTNSHYLIELIKPFHLTLPWGMNHTNYYITNKDASGTPINLVRVQEGTPTNKFVQFEFNWEGAPDPPTGLIGNVESKKATITWTKSKELDVIGYNVYMSNQFLSGFTKFNTNRITTNYFAITGLTNGVTNFVYVTAVDAYTNMPNNESPPSSRIELVTGGPVKVLFYCTMNQSFVPNGLKIGGEPSPLSWSGASMQYLYNHIWYYKIAFNEYTTIKYKYFYSSQSNVYEKLFNTPSGNREITIRDENGDGIVVIHDRWNMEHTDNPAPKAPTNIIAIPENQAISLSWTKNKEWDIKQYNIYKSISYTNAFVFLSSTKTTNFYDTTVVNNTNYFYKLTALDYAKNESPYSVIISVQPSTNPLPVPPQNLQAIPYNGRVLLSWSANRESDILGYVVYRSNSGLTFSNVAFVSHTVFTDIAVMNNTNYFYKLRAVDTAHQTNLGFSEIVSVMPSLDPPPLPPQNLHLRTIKNSQIVVSWSANEESDIKGYEIYYGNMSFSSSNFATQTIATLSNVTNGVKYTIALKAIDTNNHYSDFSDTLSAYPVKGIDDLKALPNGTETGAVSLNFTAPNQNNIGYANRYIVKYSTNQIFSLSQFQQAFDFGEVFANAPGTLETIKVNHLGTGCPGYYFTIAVVYGEEDAIALSDSVYSVSAELIPSYDATITKINDKFNVFLQKNSLPQNAKALVIKNKTDLIKENQNLDSIEQAFLSVNGSSSVRLVSSDIVYQVYPIDEAGQRVETKNNITKTVKVSVPFQDADHNGIVDNTDINIDTLRLFALNSQQWAFQQNSIVNPVDHLVYANVNSLSFFTILANLPAEDLNNVVVYPNPIIAPSDDNPIRFKNLPANAEIRIYNVAGEIVKYGIQSDEQGICLWNGLNNFDKPVASGIYIYYVDDKIHKPVKGKIGLIR